jgi:hypothetical protein
MVNTLCDAVDDIQHMGTLVMQATQSALHVKD